VVEALVRDNGQLVAVKFVVLDQLGMPVAHKVAEHVSVQATPHFGEDCKACQLSGISRVLPVNGIATFNQLSILARPGKTQTLTFELKPANADEEFPEGKQTVIVRLPRCHWGQANTDVGCYNCTAPLFSFSPDTTKCSICPDNTAKCSGTTLLPGEGYWNSGPLSTRMHKCPRRNACLR
jgi:hypothetical protein